MSKPPKSFDQLDPELIKQLGDKYREILTDGVSSTVGKVLTEITFDADRHEVWDEALAVACMTDMLRMVTTSFIALQPGLLDNSQKLVSLTINAVFEGISAGGKAAGRDDAQFEIRTTPLEKGEPLPERSGHYTDDDRA